MEIRRVDVLKVGSLLLRIDNEAFTRDFDIPSKDVDEQASYLKDCEVYVAYDKSTPIGFFAYKVDGDKVELKTTAVIPEYQNRGFGKRMTAKFLELTKGNTIYTVTHPKNTPAIILYLKFGFQIYGWKDNYYGDGQPRLQLKLEN